MKSGTGYDRIWRFIRTRNGKGPWTLHECAAMTECEYSHVRKFVNSLEKQGFVEQVFVPKKTKPKYFVAMPLAANTPETPKK